MCCEEPAHILHFGTLNVTSVTDWVRLILTKMTLDEPAGDEVWTGCAEFLWKWESTWSFNRREERSTESRHAVYTDDGSDLDGVSHRARGSNIREDVKFTRPDLLRNANAWWNSGVSGKLAARKGATGRARRRSSVGVAPPASQPAGSSAIRGRRNPPRPRQVSAGRGRDFK